MNMEVENEENRSRENDVKEFRNFLLNVAHRIASFSYNFVLFMIRSGLGQFVLFIFELHRSRPDYGYHLHRNEDFKNNISSKHIKWLMQHRWNEYLTGIIQEEFENNVMKVFNDINLEKKYIELHRDPSASTSSIISEPKRFYLECLKERKKHLQELVQKQKNTTPEICENLTAANRDMQSLHSKILEQIQ